jgi:hypothetical protein
MALCCRLQADKSLTDVDLHVERGTLAEAAESLQSVVRRGANPSGLTSAIAPHRLIVSSSHRLIVFLFVPLPPHRVLTLSALGS